MHPFKQRINVGLEISKKNLMINQRIIVNYGGPWGYLSKFRKILMLFLEGEDQNWVKHLF